MSQPLVSVVIPSYNRAHVIAETLESALAQSWPRVEILVVDDGSSDATEQAVAPFRDRVRYLRQRHQGLAAARNHGLSQSTGELVAWLDSDDLWHPEKLALQVALLERHPEVALCASDFSAFDEEGFFERSHVRSYYSIIDQTPGGLAGIFAREELFDTRDLPHLPEGVPETMRVFLGDLSRRLVFGNCLHPPTVMFRREAARRAGLLDAAFRKDSDYEYLLRLAQKGEAAFIDRPLMRYRYSSDQESSDEHLAEIAVSCVLVMESLRHKDPALASDPEFRRRLATCHARAAHALAEERRLPSLKHLVSSVRWDRPQARTARTLAKLFLPRPLLAGFRKLRGAV